MPEHRPCVELSVIVPAFNEAPRIASNLAETAAALRECSVSWEIILVDDGSTDETYLEAKRAQATIPQLSVLRCLINRGKGFALRVGAQAARGDLVAFLDADLELHPAQLPPFLRMLRAGRADAVVGSKRHRGARQGCPWMRRMLSESYLLLVGAIFRLPVDDTQTGLKAFRRAPLIDALADVQSHRFTFDLDLLLQFHQRGYRVVETPVTARFLRTANRLAARDIWRMWVSTFEIAARCRPRRGEARSATVSQPEARRAGSRGAGL